MERNIRNIQTHVWEKQHNFPIGHIYKRKKKEIHIAYSRIEKINNVKMPVLHKVISAANEIL